MDYVVLLPYLLRCVHASPLGLPEEVPQSDGRLPGHPSPRPLAALLLPPLPGLEMSILLLELDPLLEAVAPLGRRPQHLPPDLRQVRLLLLRLPLGAVRHRHVPEAQRLPRSDGVEHVRIPPGLHVLRVLLGSLQDLRDNLRHLALLEGVILLDYLLVEPVGVFDLGHGVGSALESRRDGDDLLDGPTESLEVVVTVQQLPDVEISDGDLRR